MGITNNKKASVITSNGAIKIKALKSVPLQINSILPHEENLNIPRKIKRRFLYCWERKKGSEEWINLGIMMTDDDGRLFDLKSFLEDKSSTENLKVNKYDPQTQIYTTQDWRFHGDAEDTICFQKWIGENDFSFKYDIYADVQSNVALKCSNYYLRTIAEPTENNTTTLYKDPFYAEERYIYELSVNSECFLMYCPPDIVHPENSDSQASSINLEFLEKPMESWVENEYTIESGDSYSKILEKFKLQKFDLYSYKDNADKIEIDNSYQINVGDTLKIPHGRYSSLQGQLISLEGTSIKASEKSFEMTPLAETDSTTLSLSRTMALHIPLNLEEQLSMLSFHTQILDIVYARIIASVKPFKESQQCLDSIALLLELLVKYPGFKTRRVEQSTPPPQAYYLNNEKGLDKVTSKDYKGHIESLNIYSKEIRSIAFSDRNPVFKQEKKFVVEQLTIIDGFFKNKHLNQKIEGWWENEKNGGPSLIRKGADKELPILFELFHDTFSTVLMVDKDVGFRKSKPIIPAEYFEVTHMKQYVDGLISLFEKEDKNHGYLKKLYEESQKDADIRNDFAPLKDYLENPPPDKVLMKDKSILEVVFSTENLKNAGTSLWSNQIGADSYVGGLLKLSERWRVVRNLASISVGQKVFADQLKLFSGLQILKGKKLNTLFSTKIVSEYKEKILFDKNDKDLVKHFKNRLKNSAKYNVKGGGNKLHADAKGKAKEFRKNYDARRTQRLEDLKKAQKNSKHVMKGSNDSAAANAPAVVSNAVSALGAFLALKDIYDYTQSGFMSDGKHIDSNFNITINLLSKLHSFGAAATGMTLIDPQKTPELLTKFATKLDSKLASKIAAEVTEKRVEKLTNITNKALSSAGVLLSIKKTYEQYCQSGDAAYRGDLWLKRLRITQAIFSGTSAAVGMAGLLYSGKSALVASTLPMLGWGLAGAGMILSTAYSLYEASKEGTQNSFEHLRNSFFDINQDIEDNSKKLDFISNAVILHNNRQPYIIDDDSYWTMINKIRDILESIKKFHNLDIIRAGTALSHKGYSMDNIAYITMELAGGEESGYNSGSYSKHLTATEEDYIRGFKEMGFYSPDGVTLDELSNKIRYSLKDPGQRTYLHFIHSEAAMFHEYDAEKFIKQMRIDAGIDEQPAAPPVKTEEEIKEEERMKYKMERKMELEMQKHSYNPNWQRDNYNY